MEEFAATRLWIQEMPVNPAREGDENMPMTSKRVPPEIRELVLRSHKFREWRPRRVFYKTATKGEDIGGNGATVPEIARHYSPSELAEAWGVSVETIRAIFRQEAGVLKIGSPGTKYKWGYTTLRIPQEVAARVHRGLAA
jgi:hypothetical protein